MSVSLTPFKDGIDRARRDIVVEYADPREGFKAELEAAGFTAPRVLELGRVQRIAAPGDKAHKPSGWCIYQEFDDYQHEGRAFGVGTYGSWRGAEKVTWTSKVPAAMSTAERSNYHAQIEAARAAQENEQRALQEAAARRAYEIWQAAPPAAPDSPYLQRKGVLPADGVKQLPDRLVIPITIDGQITSLQFIKNDGTFDHGTNKKFLTNGRKKGCYFLIPGSGDTIYIAEGYATGHSIHSATHAPCYVAFDAGNIYEVAAHVKTLNPTAKIIIAGDDDRESERNTGRIKAQQAAEGLGLQAVFPVLTGGKDFNDMHMTQGIDALRNLLLHKPEEYKVPAVIETDGDIDQPPGILGTLTDYYNATAGNSQPLFAIQTAIAIISIVCARNFETNLSNRSSLFLMNIAKSGTGKEHAKRTMEKVLDACNMSRLISGDGYTAGSAVISALQDRPRHITVIDEFSKYLQAASNKYGNSNLMEANAQLMQAIGRLDGVMRPRAYSTLNAPKDKRRELAEMKIHSPAITLLAMTTPDDLFKSIDISSVKDGFLNRFVICVSEAERSLRQHKEAIDVPQSIIDWAAMIDSRRGTANENASDEPKLTTLYFTTSAMELQTEFQQFCIDKADELEKMGLSEIPGRSNEMAMRIALITALAVNPHAEEIDSYCMGWAIKWVKHHLMVLIRHLKISVSSSEYEGNKKEILNAIRKTDGGVTWRDMQKHAPFNKHKQKELKEILIALRDADLIFDEPFQSGTKGRPTVVYKAMQ